MKGFKPTGRGMSSGFKYPSQMGFTGSTGGVMNVSGYTRRKFADGGFVRQDTPRMETGSLDEGSALIRRARSSTNLDEVSGGKTPIRPGYKKGGKIMMKKKMKKADGGYLPRGSNAKGFWASVADVPKLARELMRTGATKSVGMVKDKGTGAEISGRQKQIDDYVDDAQTGNKTASNYARGGRMKRAGGGLSQMLAQPAAMRGAPRPAMMPPQMGMAPPQRMQMGAPAARVALPMRPGMAAMRAKGGKMQLKSRC